MGIIKKAFIAGALFLILFVNISCVTTQPDGIKGKELLAEDREKAVELLKILEEININSPDTINSSFIADGEKSGKKFRVEGKAAYDKKGHYYVTLMDYVFRSPLIEAYRDGDALYFYYPTEKKILVDDINKINFYNYSGFRADFGFMQTLFTGGIPIIGGFRISKLLREKDDCYYLILENDEFFQNICFKKDMPEKILLIHKGSKYKGEVYLKSVMRKDKSYFYRSVKIVAPALGVSMDLRFSKPVLNRAVKVKSVDSLKKIKGVNVVKIN